MPSRDSHGRFVRETVAAPLFTEEEKRRRIAVAERATHCVLCNAAFLYCGISYKKMVDERTDYNAACASCYAFYCRICFKCGKRDILNPQVYGAVSASTIQIRFLSCRVVDMNSTYIAYDNDWYCGCDGAIKPEQYFRCQWCNENKFIENKYPESEKFEIRNDFGGIVTGRKICISCCDNLVYDIDCRLCGKVQHNGFKKENSTTKRYYETCEQIIYCDKHFTYNSSSYRNRILRSDLMYKCESCKKEKNPIDDGGVLANNDRLFCHPCYKKERNENKLSVSHACFPKNERDRKLFYDNYKLKFFTDDSDSYAHVGIEIETESGLYLKKGEITDRVNAIKSDGSISSWGMELLTQPSSGKELIKTIDDIYGKLKSLGWTGSYATGMHNHVDFRNPKPNEVKKMFLLGYLFEPFIQSKIPKERRGGRYSGSIRQLFSYDEILRIASKDVDKLFYSAETLGMNAKGLGNKRVFGGDLSGRKANHGNGLRYLGLNLHSIFFRGTVEFRYPHTVIDEKHAKSFALLFASLVEFARSDKFTIMFAVKNGPDKLAKDKHGKSIDEVTDVEESNNLYVKAAVDMLKLMDTPSLRMLRTINPDFLNA
jgi:Putative amidoligase enzyme